MRTDAMLALIDAYAAVALADTALDVGILDALERRPALASEIARELELDPVGVARVLTTLEAIGLVERDGDGHFHTSSAAAIVSAQSYWNALSVRLRAGAPSTGFDTARGANEKYPKLVGLMSQVLGSAPDQLAACVADAGPRILDVGAGATPWSLALARRNAACRVTAIDRPAVLDVARQYVDEAGRSAAFEFVAADITRDGFPSTGYDLAIVANVCHLFGDSTNRGLVRRLFDAVRPGGTVAIVDTTAEDEPTSVSTALYALSLFVRTTEGDVHPFSSYCAWLREAGFTDVERATLHAVQPISLMTATRPLS